MMKNNIKYLILLLCLQQQLNAQNIYDKHTVFSTILDAAGHVNPYYTSGNPAYLSLDTRDQLLSLETSWSSMDGEYRKFFQPGSERMYTMDFSGKKNLDSAQIFKGLFSLNRMERHNWKWLSVKDYDNGSPFLFGDSTTGRSRYNGIFMNAQYSSRLTKRLTAGFSLSYGVDEGLKEITPRPSSDHRDIDFTLGAAYAITPALSAGAYFRVSDLFEQISYSEDEAAIYQETILFKIRGFDYPLRISKKVENRFSYHNRYAVNSDLFYKSPVISAAVFLGAAAEQIVIKEDVSSPRLEGYWNNDWINTGVSASLILSDNWRAGLLYKLTIQQMWARHPVFNVLIMDSDIKEHEASAGLEYKVDENLSCGIEFNGKFTNTVLDDYYGDLSYSYELSGFNLLAGVDYIWNDDLKTTITAGAGKTKSYNVDIYNNSPSEFFLRSRYTDLMYLSSDLITTRVHVNSEINTGFPGIINIHLVYLNNIVDDNSSFFSSAERSFISAAVELKIKVY